MEPTKLTEAVIRQLAFEGKPVVVRDTIVKGLMVAVNRHSKSYKVQRDLWVGQRGRRRKTKTVRHTLGTTLDLTLDDARTRAMEVIAQIKRGIDPNEKDVAPGAETWTVERMFDEYMHDLRRRDCAERTISDVLVQMNRYLADWKSIPISDITRTMARDKHSYISTNHGKSVANSSMRLFKAGFNLAMRVVDDPDTLPDNPVSAVTFNKVRSSKRVLMPDDLPDWWKKVQALPNPLRRTMHTLGLFSGLRPGTLVSLRREWIHLEEHAISIPRMKSGEPFDLPLSNYMIELVQEALQVGDMLYPRSEWLFPTRNPRGQVIATAVWREKTLPSQTGHILRHSWRTIAQRVGLDKIDARMLLDHKIVGIDRVYVHEKALFDRLLVSQEQMTSAIRVLVADDKFVPRNGELAIEGRRNGTDASRGLGGEGD